MPDQDSISELATTRITLGEVYRLIKDQSSDVTEIKNDVKAQNSSVAELKTKVALLEDRGAQAKDNHARYAGWSGVIAAVASFLWQMFHK